MCKAPALDNPGAGRDIACMGDLPTWEAIVVTGVIGAVACCVAASLGWFRAGAMRGLPPRMVGLGAPELGAGLALMLIGIVVFDALRLRFLPDAGAAAATPMDRARLVLIAQAITQLPVVILLLILTRGSWRELGVPGDRPRRQALWGVGVGMVALGLVTGTHALSMLAARLMRVDQPEVGHEMLTAMKAAGLGPAQWLMIVSAVVVAPVLEEMIFRALMQTSLLGVLGRGRRWAVIITASLLFTVVHAGSVWAFALPGIFVLGVIMGGMYERTGSIVGPIVVHVIFNAVNTALMLIAH